MATINISSRAKQKLESLMIAEVKKKIKKDCYKKKKYFISYSSFIVKLTEKYHQNKAA